MLDEQIVITTNILVISIANELRKNEYLSTHHDNELRVENEP